MVNEGCKRLENGAGSVVEMEVVGVDEVFELGLLDKTHELSSSLLIIFRMRKGNAQLARGGHRGWVDIVGRVGLRDGEKAALAGRFGQCSYV